MSFIDDCLKKSPTVTFWGTKPTYHTHRTEEESKQGSIDYLVGLGFSKEKARAWYTAYRHTSTAHPLEEEWNTLEYNGIEYETDDEANEPYQEKCRQMAALEDIFGLYKTKMRELAADYMKMVTEAGGDLSILEDHLAYGIKTGGFFRPYTPFSIEPI